MLEILCITFYSYQADLRSETYIGDVVGIEEGQSYACENGLEFFEGTLMLYYCRTMNFY